MSTSPSSSTSLFRRDQKPSDLALERYLLGELSHQEVHDLELLMKETPEINQRLNAIKTLNQDLSTRLRPPQELRDRVASNTVQNEHRPQSTWNLWFWLAPVGLGLLLLVSFRSSLWTSKPSINAPIPLNPYGQTRTKGGATTWEVYLAPSAQTPKEQAKQLQSGQTIQPGQQIGFRVFPKKDGHYMIIGQDEQNGMYLGAPTSAGSPDQQYTRPLTLPQSPISYVDLQEALEFDNQLGTETLFFFYCQNQMSYKTLKEALELDPTAPSLSKSCQVSSFTLIKKDEKKDQTESSK